MSSSLDKLVNELYKELAHGDEQHRAWLKETIVNFFETKVTVVMLGTDAEDQEVWH